MQKNNVIHFNWIFLYSNCLLTIVMCIYAVQPIQGDYFYSNLTDFFQLFGIILWAISPYLTLLFALPIILSKGNMLKTFSIFIVMFAIISDYFIATEIFRKIPVNGLTIFKIFPIYQWIVFLSLFSLCMILFKFTPKRG